MPGQGDSFVQRFCKHSPTHSLFEPTQKHARYDNVMLKPGAVDGNDACAWALVDVCRHVRRDPEVSAQAERGGHAVELQDPPQDAQHHPEKQVRARALTMPPTSAATSPSWVAPMLLL